VAIRFGDRAPKKIDLLHLWAAGAHKLISNKLVNLTIFISMQSMQKKQTEQNEKNFSLVPAHQHGMWAHGDTISVHFDM